MKELIDRIMEIDRTADEQLTQAQEMREQAMRDIDQHKHDLTEEIADYAENHLNDLDQSEQAAADESMEKLKQRFALEEKRLQDIFDRGNAAWTSEIVSKVLQK